MATTNKNFEPAKPAVTLSERTRQELAMNGHSVSPFTGELLVGSDASDVRVVDEKEYLAVAKANSAKRAERKPSNLR